MSRKPLSAMMYKTEMCNSVVQDVICRYGNACHFAHSVDEKRAAPKIIKTKMCWFYNFGANGCTNKKCTFAHSEDKLKTKCAYGSKCLYFGTCYLHDYRKYSDREFLLRKMCSLYLRLGATTAYKTVVCRNEQKGVCTLGIQCGFYHPRKNDVTPCINGRDEDCGKECDRVHLYSECERLGYVKVSRGGPRMMCADMLSSFKTAPLMRGAVPEDKCNGDGYDCGCGNPQNHSWYKNIRSSDDMPEGKCDCGDGYCAGWDSKSIGDGQDDESDWDKDDYRDDRHGDDDGRHGDDDVGNRQDGDYSGYYSGSDGDNDYPREDKKMHAYSDRCYTKDCKVCELSIDAGCWFMTNTEGIRMDLDNLDDDEYNDLLSHIAQDKLFVDRMHSHRVAYLKEKAAQTEGGSTEGGQTESPVDKDDPNHQQYIDVSVSSS